MEIFYIDIEEFKKTHPKEFLAQFLDVDFKLEKRFYEYTIGRYLIKNAAKTLYGVKDTEIIKNQNNKPVFKNSSLCFNLSHTKNIVAVGFDHSDIGLDIEYIKERNLEKLSKYFKYKFLNLDDFYKFWTKKEAEYKLGMPYSHIFSLKFKNKYFLSVAVSNKMDKAPHISPYLK